MTVGACGGNEETLFDYGVQWPEPSTWDFDFVVYTHWLEDSYYQLGRDWKEGQECESKEVLCVFAGPTVHPYPDSWDESMAVAEWMGESWEDTCLEVTSQERCGCYFNDECDSI